MRRLREGLIKMILFIFALTSVGVTIGIVGILISESLPFFTHVSVVDFLTGTEWTPLFEQARFGILPLVLGTVLVTCISVVIAIPSGTVIAMILTEYLSPKKKEIIKPVLELLAAVPTVVYGYFALFFVTPILKKLFPQIAGFNALSAGVVIGIMIIPYICSLAEDSMRAVPQHLKEASYAMGSSKLQTCFRVIFPSALSGIVSAYILGISRALGETMVVSIAAGMQPQMSINPLESTETMTAFIVQVSMGDLPHGSIGFQSIYVVGLALFLMTLSFNLFGFWIKKKFKVSERV